MNKIALLHGYNDSISNDDFWNSMIGQTSPFDACYIINPVSSTISESLLQSLKSNSIALKIFDDFSEFWNIISKTSDCLYFSINTKSILDSYYVKFVINTLQTESKLLLICNGFDNNEISLESMFPLSTQDKIWIKEGKSDQVFSTPKRNLENNLAFNGSIFDKLSKPKIELLDFTSWVIGVSSGLVPDKIYWSDEAYNKLHFQEGSLEMKPKSELISSQIQSLEAILESVENRSFRRAHYFWYMRSILPKKSFLQRFISINTLLLEGDYKRHTNSPISEAFSDLRFSS